MVAGYQRDNTKRVLGAKNLYLINVVRGRYLGISKGKKMTEERRKEMEESSKLERSGLVERGTLIFVLSVVIGYDHRFRVISLTSCQNCSGINSPRYICQTNHALSHLLGKRELEPGLITLHSDIGMI